MKVPLEWQKIYLHQNKKVNKKPMWIAVLDFQKKMLGPAGPQVFIFGRQNKSSSRQILYLRTNGIQ